MLFKPNVHWFLLYTEANNDTSWYFSIQNLPFKNYTNLRKQSTYWISGNYLTDWRTVVSTFLVSGSVVWRMLNHAEEFQIHFDKLYSTGVACHLSIATHTHLLFTKLHRNRSLYHTCVCVHSESSQTCALPLHVA